ncbi:ribonuclease H-like domain-containing protein [Tanacetum coccineum]|uniref:Ribonuclease H-like domain-containing protein n=1 Tax=Tanacetum coccineum TaxID=301880 RepID=A0ABQ5EX53_9ASTR
MSNTPHSPYGHNVRKPEYLNLLNYELSYHHYSPFLALNIHALRTSLNKARPPVIGPMHQLDVKNAFLHGQLSEIVYMHQPPGFVDTTHPDYVCHLQRSLYGLKQAPRACLHKRSSSGLFLSQSKFAEEILERAHMQHCNPCRTPVDTESKLGSDGDPVSDPTLYRSLAGALQYLTFTRPDISYAVQQRLGVDFDETFSPVVKPATIRTVLSLVVSRKWPIHQLDVKNAFLNGDLSETVYMHQLPGFIDARFPNHVCHLQRSLYGLKQAPRAWFQRFADDIILTASSLALLQQIIDSLHNEFDMTDLGALNYFLGISADRNSTGVPVQDPTLYHSLAGGLQYLTFTRPNLSYAVQQLYASATISLVSYIDIDWAGCPSTRRSTSGYCVFLGNNLLSWSAKRQHTISRSSAEAEYRGVANVVAETAWLRNLLRELHSPLSTVTLVYCDNVSAVYMSANPVQHQRTKHIEIDIHFVRDMVTAGQVRVLHVPSRFQYADIFTKGLPSALFEEFRSSLSVRPPPAPTAGAY